MKEKRFTRAERLTKDREFRRVFGRGRSFSDGKLVVYVYCRGPAEGEKVRLGLVVSRKLGKAVRRNKLKRRLREIFRLNKNRLKPRQDIIFLPRLGATDRNYQELEESVLSLFRKAKLFAE